jgi:hypothetical protein
MMRICREKDLLEIIPFLFVQGYALAGSLFYTDRKRIFPADNSIDLPV